MKCSLMKGHRIHTIIDIGDTCALTLPEKTLHKDHTHYQTENSVRDAFIAGNCTCIQAIVKSVNNKKHVNIHLIFCV